MTEPPADASASHRPSRRRRASRIAGRTLAAVIALLLSVRSRRRVWSGRTGAHPAPGDLVDVGDGRRIHLLVASEEHDGPTVVPKAGAAWSSGIGTTWLVESAHALPPEGREVVMPVVVDWWESLNRMHWLALIGIGAWLVFGVSAAVAHQRAGSGWLVVAGLALGSLFAAGHGSLPGAIPLFTLAAAGWKLTRPLRAEPT